LRKEITKGALDSENMSGTQAMLLCPIFFLSSTCVRVHTCRFQYRNRQSSVSNLSFNLLLRNVNSSTSIPLSTLGTPNSTTATGFSQLLLRLCQKPILPFSLVLFVGFDSSSTSHDSIQLTSLTNYNKRSAKTFCNSSLSFKFRKIALPVP